ncbi:MAG: efflux transporter outer membrane subunit, partial [Pseudomonadota bacterium]|nr:efflux transporter outer membrane subunit [Pseudomonadota bacterium]
QAQSQLDSIRAQLIDLGVARTQYEHAVGAIADLKLPSFSIPESPLNLDSTTDLPKIPLGLPSQLLERRPDIAAAERHVAVANANIGVARAAYFPSLTLSASGNQGSTRLGDLFNASSFAWSLGLSLAETIFDGGARTARVEEAQAAWKQSVAQYRQAVLTAFSGVEDQLSAAASLEQQQALRRIASQAADQTEQEMQNRYKQGLVAYTDVVTAQASALSARRALMQVSLNRQTAAINMVSALGGGWSTQQLAAN